MVSRGVFGLEWVYGSCNVSYNQWGGMDAGIMSSEGTDVYMFCKSTIPVIHVVVSLASYPLLPARCNNCAGVIVRQAGSRG